MGHWGPRWFGLSLGLELGFRARLVLLLFTLGLFGLVLGSL